MKHKPKVVVGYLTFDLSNPCTDAVAVWGFGYSQFQAAASVPFKYRHLSYIIYDVWHSENFHPDLVIATRSLENFCLRTWRPQENFETILRNQREGIERPCSPAGNRVRACLRAAKYMSGSWYDAERRRLHKKRWTDAMLRGRTI